jgi:hypothetical protein
LGRKPRAGSIPALRTSLLFELRDSNGLDFFLLILVGASSGAS